MTLNVASLEGSGCFPLSDRTAVRQILLCWLPLGVCDKGGRTQTLPVGGPGGGAEWSLLAAWCPSPACLRFSPQTTSSALKGAIQLGITHTVGSLSTKPERDVLMQDFYVVESIFFPRWACVAGGCGSGEGAWQAGASVPDGPSSSSSPLQRRQQPDAGPPLQ